MNDKQDETHQFIYQNSAITTEYSLKNCLILQFVELEWQVISNNISITLKNYQQNKQYKKTFCGQQCEIETSTNMMSKLQNKNVEIQDIISALNDFKNTLQQKCIKCQNFIEEEQIKSDKSIISLSNNIINISIIVKCLIGNRERVYQQKISLELNGEQKQLSSLQIAKHYQKFYEKRIVKLKQYFEQKLSDTDKKLPQLLKKKTQQFQKLQKQKREIQQKLKSQIKAFQNRLNQQSIILNQYQDTICMYRSFLPNSIVQQIEPHLRRRTTSKIQSIDNYHPKQSQQQNQVIDDQRLSSLKGLISQAVKKWQQNQKMPQFRVSGQSNSKISYISSESKVQKYLVGQQIFQKKQSYFSWFVPSPTNPHLISYQGSYISRIFGGWCQLLFNQAIPSDKPFTFKIKISKSERRLIIIGIVDRKKQMQNRSPSDNNFIGYYGRWGKLYPSGIQIGKGFKQGEIIKVKVNLKQKKIRWIAGNQVLASLKQCNIMGEQGREFVPYVEMRQIQDQIQWMGCQVGQSDTQNKAETTTLKKSE